ncbi:hypothetical protein N0V90_003576 [Kalmusia sp. IMI 367209]|nr:hypothetical protein N0V90_003576 [Kalmusia sp. IMI 367209]
MEQTFFFVNGTQHDRTAKRQMRRHVMIGKNAGRTLQRKSRPKKLRCQPLTPPDEFSRDVQQLAQWDRRSKLGFYSPENIYSNVLAGLSFPVKLTPHFAEIISNFLLFIANKLYPVQLGISMDASKYTWINVLMSDEAGEGEDSPKAIYHLSNSLTYVRERLDSGEALSDSTMGIVMSLITQEQVRKKQKAAKIHMDGLAKMIELRGGLESLEGSLPVLLKACKTDIMFTLHHEDVPRFYRDKLPEIKANLEAMNIPFDRDSAQKQIQHPSLNPRFLDILLDVINTSTLFNDLLSTHRVDLYTFQEILVSICYRLFAFDAQRNTEKPTIQDAYLVGLKLFMMSLFLQVGRQRLMEYDNMTCRLRGVLERGALDGEDELKLWLLMMGGVWILDDVDAEWLVPMAKEQARRMGLSRWDEAYEVLRKYPWIEALHDESGRTVWERSHRGD